MKKNLQKIKSIFLICAALHIAGAASAQDISLADSSMYELSLEDLMKITVTTASKAEERIEDAPAVMNIITAKEIESYGANSLSEVLDRLTSIYMISTYFAPEGMISMRGTQTDLYNTKVLILLDNRPLRESFHGGYNGVINSMMPVDRIERIEIIRGPGSVLYGTGAFAGVINIVTKTGDAARGFSAQIKYGSFNTKQGSVGFGKKINAFDISGGVNFIESDGWKFTARGESDVIRNKANTADSVYKAPTTINRDISGISGVLKIGYKGLVLNTFAAQNEWATMGRTPSWLTPTEYRIENNRYFGDLTYSLKLNDIWSTSLSATYNYFLYRSFASVKADDYIRRKSVDGLFEFTNYIKPVRNLNIVIGGLMNIQTGKGVDNTLDSDGNPVNIDADENSNPWFTVPSYNYTWYAAYGQVDYTLIERIKLIAGAQLNTIDEVGTNISPRFGAILSANDNLGVKILYGQAFRSPVAFERYSLSPNSVAGSSSLTPETMTTIESQIFYNTKKMNLSATYFRNHDANSISRKNFAQTINGVNFTQLYINTGYVNIQGVELESKYNLKALNFTGSFTYQTSRNNLDQENQTGIPQVMGKLGVTYNHKKLLKFGLFNSYYGKPADYYLYSATTGARLTKMANPEVKAFNYMSLNVSCNLKEAMSNFPNLTVNVYVNNLLDQEVYYPELVRRNINSLPGRPGRAVFAGLVYKM
jgi:outer membrane receptor for ferrienterochelin and colicins